jgi:hypothetical protein
MVKAEYRFERSGVSRVGAKEKYGSLNLQFSVRGAVVTVSQRGIAAG